MLNSNMRQVGSWPCAVYVDDAARQTDKPCSLSRQAAALTAAIIIVGCPLDELFGHLMPPTAEHDSIGAKLPSLTVAKALQANFSRGVNEHRQIKERNDWITPAL